MSWSRLLPAATLLLAACGFHPLYGPASESTPAAPTIQSQLEAIKVIPSADRIGQLLFNNLRDKLNPRGTPAEPRYVLTVSLAESEQELLLRQDETATRINLTVT